MGLFKYPELVSQLSENADEANVNIEDFTADLIVFAFLARIQTHFDEDGHLADREALVVESADFVKRVLLAVAQFTAAFCGEPTEEDDLVLNETKH